MADCQNPYIRSTMSWQNTITELPEKLSYIKNTGQFSDVTLIVGQGKEATRFTVHRMMLAMYSEVMSALFYGPMKETKEEIALTEDEPDCFELMLRFIYCQDVEFFCVEDAIGTYSLADKYIIPQLQEKCLEFLHRNITTETVLQIYEMANATDQLDLRKECWKYIARSTTKVLTSPEFGEASDSTVQRIVGENYLTITSEVEIYKALCAWGKRECERRYRKVTWENTRLVLEPYLPQVHFLTLSAEEFITALEDLEVLTKEEQLCILKNLLIPEVCCLPEVCSRWKKKRKPFPSNSDFFRFERKCKRSLSRIIKLYEVKETFQVSKDVCICGVEFYISLSESDFVPPEPLEWTLSIRNLSGRSETTEICIPYVRSSDYKSEGVIFTVEKPVCVRDGEVCEITLQGDLERYQIIFCCTGDCHRHPFEFTLLDKELGCHFHAVYALPI